MKKKSFLVLGLLSLSALVFAGCRIQPELPQPETTPQVVKIGVIAPLSWPAASYGSDAVNVYKDRVEQFNQSQTATQVQLIVEDGKCEGKDAASAAQKLINIDKIDVLLWGRCSSETMTAGPLAQEQGIATMAAGSSAPEVATIGNYVYRFWNDTISAKKLASYMNQKYSKVALVYESTDVAQQALYQTFLKNYQGEVVLTLGIDGAEKDYALLVQKLKNQKDQIEAIVMMGQDESTIAFIKELKKADLLAKFQSDFFGFYQMTSNAVVEALGKESLEGMKQVNANMGILGSSTPAQEYLAHFKEKFTVQGVDAFVFFDVEGVDLLLDAIKSGARKSDDFISYFKSFTAEKMRKGLLGTYYFNEDREAAGLENVIEIQEIRDGVWVNID